MPTTNETAAPAIRVGIPAGVDPENVRSRQAAMMNAGMPEIIASSIAISAAEQQHLHDQKRKLKAEVKEETIKAPVLKVETEKVKGPVKTAAPKKVSTPVPAKKTVAAVKKGKGTPAVSSGVDAANTNNPSGAPAV